MTRKCSLCAGEGHNMTTCTHLRFRQEQMSRLYAHKWQKWAEMFALASQDEGYVMEYLEFSEEMKKENVIWLKKPLHLRLLRSYLNISPAGSSEKELIDFISELYRYLISKKNRLYIHSVSYEFDKYDWILASFRRDYGIIVEQKTCVDNVLFGSCTICYEDYSVYSFVKTNCDHSFCHKCIVQTIKILPENKKLCCAMCRSNITHLSCYTSEIERNLKANL